MQFFPHLFEDSSKIAAQPVHLVNKGKTGNMIAVCLVPDGFRLGFNPANGAENRHHAIKNPQAALDFNREINMPRSINNGDAVVVPLTGSSRGSNGNAPLLFLFHPIHQSGPIMNLTDFVGQAGTIKDPLGDGGFSGINVSGNTDISQFAERFFHNLFNTVRNGNCFTRKYC